MGKRRRRLHRMPFGKYKGRRITKLPTDYLGWLEHNTRNQVIQSIVSHELRKRRVSGRGKVDLLDSGKVLPGCYEMGKGR